MKRALLDNWTIEDIAGKKRNIFVSPSVKVQVLVSALVLWDEVCYLDNGYSEWWNFAIDCNKELEILRLLKPINPEEYKQSMDRAQDDYSNLYQCNYQEVVAKGALEYLYISDNNDMCYIPFGDRVNFIEENELFKNTHQYYTRMDLIELIDEEIKNYYTTINRHIRRANFYLDTSCIYNYVKRNAGTVEEMVDVINSLKNERMVIRFRKWVEKMEQAIHNPENIGNPSNIILDYIEELKEIKESFRHNMDIGITVGMPFATLGVNIPIHVTRRTKPNLVFPALLYDEAIGRNTRNRRRR